jgi:cytoskeletal protein CcmA (bactofilin family)
MFEKLACKSKNAYNDDVLVIICLKQRRRNMTTRPVKQIEDKIVNSIIGEGSEFKGEFTINGLLRIDGKFKGTIDTEGKVLIGQTGEAVTDIRASVVVVGGKVKGNIFATERVIMLSTGHVEGNIITPGLIMEDGVMFEGNCTINKRIEQE